MATTHVSAPPPGAVGYPYLRSLVEDYLTNRLAREPGVAGLELIHTFSLIHDDLPAIDDDDLRRGLPTSHKRFGVDVAILAGDALYAEAFKLVLREQRGEPAHVLAAIAELADATGINAELGKPHGSDERHRKRNYVSQHGLQGARLLAAQSHEKARAALAHTAGHGASELVQIADLVYTRCS